MLVLSRHRDETIKIGDDIEVTVVDIRGDKVRLGVNAPKAVGVHRKEVYDAIHREERAACQVKLEDLAGLGVSVLRNIILPVESTSDEFGRIMKEGLRGLQLSDQVRILERADNTDKLCFSGTLQELKSHARFAPYTHLSTVKNK